MRSSISREQKARGKTGRDEGCNMKSGDLKTDSESDLYAKNKEIHNTK